MPKQKTPKKCLICSKLRPIEKHLYELSEYCLYLGNSIQYKKENNIRTINTETIGSWLRLASQLEKVKIDTWKFSGSDGFYCDSAADRFDSDSDHFTNFSTDLTRFIFVCHALEETYRLFANNYDNLPEIKKLNEKKRFREASMKTAFLIDQCSAEDLPKELMHIVLSFSRAYDLYIKKFSPQLSGMEKIKPSDFSYGLHLVRNLRNHIAHGVFPLLENPDYYGDEDRTHFLLTEILNRASRISALYIQMLLAKYCSEFSSYEYDQIVGARGKMFKRFLKNCNPDYARTLHFSVRFQFERWIEH